MNKAKKTNNGKSKEVLQFEKLFQDATSEEMRKLSVKMRIVSEFLAQDGFQTFLVIGGQKMGVKGDKMEVIPSVLANPIFQQKRSIIIDLIINLLEEALSSEGKTLMILDKYDGDNNKRTNMGSGNG